MSEQTGIVYPTITLGGVEYTIKFTRGALTYRMSKIGVDLGDFNKAMEFSRTIDIARAVMLPQFIETAEELADIVLREGKIGELRMALVDALGKVFLPTQEKAAETVGNPAAAIQ